MSMIIGRIRRGPEWVSEMLCTMETIRLVCGLDILVPYLGQFFELQALLEADRLYHLRAYKINTGSRFTAG